jgi:guanylate kinase
MYTDKALLMRESLKFDPRIVSVLEQIWEAADHDHSGAVSKDEYFVMSLKLNRVFNESEDDREEGDVRIEDSVFEEGDALNLKVTADQGAGGETLQRQEAEAVALALAQASEDWKRDSFGADTMDRTMFFQAWFELADIWTEVIDVEEYASFLRIILGAFSFINESGVRVFRADDEVQGFMQAQKKHLPSSMPPSHHGSHTAGAIATAATGTSSGGNDDGEAAAVLAGEAAEEAVAVAAAASSSALGNHASPVVEGGGKRATMRERLSQQAEVKAGRVSRQAMLRETMCRRQTSRNHRHLPQLKMRRAMGQEEPLLHTGATGAGSSSMVAIEAGGMMGGGGAESSGKRRANTMIVFAPPDSKSPLVTINHSLLGNPPVHRGGGHGGGGCGGGARGGRVRMVKYVEVEGEEEAEEADKQAEGSSVKWGDVIGDGGVGGEIVGVPGLLPVVAGEIQPSTQSMPRTRGSPSSIRQAPRVTKQEQETESARPRDKPLLIAGPSGVGKGALVKMLVADYPDSFRVFSDGEDATSKSIDDVTAQGKICIDIQCTQCTQGVRSVKKPSLDTHGRCIFVEPPSMDALQRRQRRNKGTDESEEQVQAITEMDYGVTIAETFDAKIVNDDLQRAYDELVMTLRSWYSLPDPVGQSANKAGAEGVVKTRQMQDDAPGSGGVVLTTVTSYSVSQQLLYAGSSDEVTNTSTRTAEVLELTAPVMQPQLSEEDEKMLREMGLLKRRDDDDYGSDDGEYGEEEEAFEEEEEEGEEGGGDEEEDEVKKGQQLVLMAQKKGLMAQQKALKKGSLRETETPTTTQYAAALRGRVYEQYQDTRKSKSSSREAIIQKAVVYRQQQHQDNKQQQDKQQQDKQQQMKENGENARKERGEGGERDMNEQGGTGEMGGGTRVGEEIEIIEVGEKGGMEETCDTGENNGGARVEESKAQAGQAMFTNALRVSMCAVSTGDVFLKNEEEMQQQFLMEYTVLQERQRRKHMQQVQQRKQGDQQKGPLTHTFTTSQQQQRRQEKLELEQQRRASQVEANANASNEDENKLKRQHTKQQLVNFYDKHDHAKKGNIDKMLKHFTAEQIEARLTEKYGNAPTATGGGGDGGKDDNNHDRDGEGDDDDEKGNKNDEKGPEQQQMGQGQKVQQQRGAQAADSNGARNICKQKAVVLIPGQAAGGVNSSGVSWRGKNSKVCGTGTGTGNKGGRQKVAEKQMFYSPEPGVKALGKMDTSLSTVDITASFGVPDWQVQCGLTQDQKQKQQHAERHHQRRQHQVQKRHKRQKEQHRVTTNKLQRLQKRQNHNHKPHRSDAAGGNRRSGEAKARAGKFAAAVAQTEDRGGKNAALSEEPTDVTLDSAVSAPPPQQQQQLLQQSLANVSYTSALLESCFYPNIQPPSGNLQRASPIHAPLHRELQAYDTAAEEAKEVTLAEAMFLPQVVVPPQASVLAGAIVAGTPVAGHRVDEHADGARFVRGFADDGQTDTSTGTRSVSPTAEGLICAYVDSAGGANNDQVLGAAAAAVAAAATPLHAQTVGPFGSAQSMVHSTAQFPFGFRSDERESSGGNSGCLYRGSEGRPVGSVGEEEGWQGVRGGGRAHRKQSHAASASHMIHCPSPIKLSTRNKLRYNQRSSTLSKSAPRLPKLLSLGGGGFSNTPGGPTCSTSAGYWSVHMKPPSPTNTMVALVRSTSCLDELPPRHRARPPDNNTAVVIPEGKSRKGSQWGRSA